MKQWFGKNHRVHEDNPQEATSMQRLASTLLLLGFSYWTATALDFDLGGKAFAPKNPILAPLRAGQAIAALTDTNHPAEFTVVRKKLENGNYALFQGRLQKEARATLHAYHSAQQDAWKLMLNAQFYSKDPSCKAPELSEVYWDAGIILAATPSDTLYVQTKQQTEMLVATHDGPVNLKVSTDPIRATVFINGISQDSTTPTEIHWVGNHLFLVRISKFGYQSWEDLVEADADGNANIEVNLTQSPHFHSGALADSTSLNAHDSKDYHAVAAILGHILTGPFTHETEKASIWLSNYLDTLRNRQYVEYIPPQNLSVGDYSKAKGGLPVRIWYGDHDFDFGFEGVISCSNEESSVLKQMLVADQKSVHLKDSQRSRPTTWPSAPANAKLDGFLQLKYRNWATDARTNSRSVHRYLALDSLSLLLPDRSLAIQGNFIPAAYIKSSKDWKEYLRAMEAFGAQQKK